MDETYQDLERCKPTSAWAQGLRYSTRPRVARIAYVSGPMRGIPEFNFPAFDAARDALLAAGWNVISPADIDRACPVEALDPRGVEQSTEAIDAYVARDLEAIKLLKPQTDAVVLLEGWKGSRGATAEASVAAWRGVQVIDLETAIGPMAQPYTSQELLGTFTNAAGHKVEVKAASTEVLVDVPGEATTLPTDTQARKEIPLMRGFLDYFPAAAAEVAHVSAVGGRQHGHGDDIFWERGKSADHADCAIRHLLERGTRDSDGLRHSAKAAWRALANLQLELEAEGAPIARGAR